MTDNHTPEPIKATPAGPEKESWVRFSWKEKQETPKRYEDAAKFLASMISISLAIFLSIAGKNGLSTPQHTTGIRVALVLWFLSMLLAFIVLFPLPYKYAKDSIASFQKAHAKIVRVKGFLLSASLVSYFIALFILGAIFF